MDPIQDLLKEKGGSLIGGLVSQAGFSYSQAQSFVPAAVAKIVDLLKGGGLDIGSLLSGGGVSSLISKLDIGSLASQAGVDETAATKGLESLVPSVVSSLQDKAGGAAGVLSMLGGGTSPGVLEGAGNLADKFLNR